MKPSVLFLLAAVLPLGTPTLLRAAEPNIVNPAIDFAGHLEMARKAEATRAARRLTEEQFLKMASEPGTVVLDARSPDKYQLRHFKGAVNLPFTDFAEGTLAKTIPAKDTRVLIYCNNNFRGDRIAFAEKADPASLNISTYISLVIYGYTNVYELGPLLDVQKTILPFEGTASK